MVVFLSARADVELRRNLFPNTPNKPAIEQGQGGKVKRQAEQELDRSLTAPRKRSTTTRAVSQCNKRTLRD